MHLFSQNSLNPSVSRQRTNGRKPRSESTNRKSSDMLERAKIAHKIYVLSCEKNRNDERISKLSQKGKWLTPIGNYDDIKYDIFDTESEGKWSSSNLSMSEYIESDDVKSEVENDYLEQVNEIDGRESSHLNLKKDCNFHQIGMITNY